MKRTLRNQHEDVGSTLCGLPFKGSIRGKRHIHLKSLFWISGLLACFLLLVALPSFSQPLASADPYKMRSESDKQEFDITVSGKVTAQEDGGPLPGVNVVVKGTSNGTVTDGDGNFRLTVSENAILVFSFIGFQTQEVQVGNRTTINVSLAAEVSELDEVVVVGYGTQSKRNITGSVASINMENSSDDVTVTEAMTGVPGVQFNETGRPGQVGNLLIRGQNSLSGNNNPLIVLDGIIFNGSLADINPQDIKSMDVLKDASSTAIYGSRAANGVILITSKEGVTEKPTITVNAYSGISEWASKVKSLTPERYLQRRLDWREQSGLEADPAKITDYISATEAENYRNGHSIDPWDEISQQGRSSSLDLSVSSRSEFTNYYLSASLSDEKGLIFNDNQKRYSFRANINTDIKSWLSIGVNSMFTRRDLSGVNADVSDAYRISPLGTMYYPDGEPTEFPVADEQAGNNPMLGALLTTNEEIRDNLFSNFFASINVPFIEGLSYRLNFSPSYRWNHDYNSVRQNQYASYNNTSASKFNQKEFNWFLENIVNYDRSLGRDHNFGLTLLYGRNHFESESTLANAQLFNVDVLGYNNLGLGDILTNSSLAQAAAGVSYMARLNYQFKNKYLLTLTARRDGSSVFSVNNKYATFPSGAIAWIASDEPFLEVVKFIDMLKLRASYGAVGNQAIEPYQSLTLSDIQRYVYGNGGASSLGVVTSRLGNDDLKWETTYTANLAVDFDLFQQRIGGTIELYNSNTEDLLVRRTIPVMNGYNSILTNVGQVNNRGIEIMLNTANIRKENLEWNSSFTFTRNRNEIVHLFRTDLDGDGREDDNIANSWFIGEPINSYYDYVFDGIYQEGDDVPAGSQPGFVRVRDLDGDGEITADDRTVVGSGGNPDYQFSLRNDVRYGNFSLSVFINAMQGWIAPFNLINPLVPGRSLNQLDAGWWTSENQSNTRPSLVYSNPLRTNWYMSRDFVRLRDVTFAYSFNKTALEKFNVSGLRLFLTGKNLYIITDWLGTDPESGGSYTSQQGSDDLYPMPRTFLLGATISF